MPSKYRIHMTVSKEVFEAVETISKLQGCSRGSVLSDWVSLSEPCLVSVSSMLSRADHMSRSEKQALATVLSDVSQMLDLAASATPLGFGISAGGGTDGGRADAEPPSSNTGVPSSRRGVVQ